MFHDLATIQVHILTSMYSMSDMFSLCAYTTQDVTFTSASPKHHRFSILIAHLNTMHIRLVCEKLLCV